MQKRVILRQLHKCCSVTKRNIRWLKNTLKSSRGNEWQKRTQASRSCTCSLVKTMVVPSK
jgi:hypothetical protein